jgi:DNA uptake protein ComE-like DNA-binding protein
VLASQAAPAKVAQTKAPASTVNLSMADLEVLPGVGPAAAKKIIAIRPYASVTDLSKAGVPKNTIAKITSMVTVAAASVRPWRSRRQDQRPYEGRA